MNTVLALSLVLSLIGGTGQLIASRHPIAGWTISIALQPVWYAFYIIVGGYFLLITSTLYFVAAVAHLRTALHYRGLTLRGLPAHLARLIADRRGRRAARAAGYDRPAPARENDELCRVLLTEEGYTTAQGPVSRAEALAEFQRMCSDGCGPWSGTAVRVVTETEFQRIWPGIERRNEPATDGRYWQLRTQHHRTHAAQLRMEAAVETDPDRRDELERGALQADLLAEATTRNAQMYDSGCGLPMSAGRSQ